MRTPLAPRRIHSCGFTLIEAVVALAILALALTTTYQVFGWSLRRGAEQRQRAMAWLTAQSLLSELRADRPVVEGHREGRTPQGLSWRIQIEPHPVQSTTTTAIPLLRVAVDVRWGNRSSQRVELQSIELGTVQ